MRDDRLLWRHLAGALEPGEALDLAARLRAEPALRARRAELEAQLQDAAISPLPTASSSWVLPPPGRSGGRQPWSLDHVQTSLDAGLRPGAVTTLRLDPPDTLPRAVVVLRREEADWDVVFPTSEPALAWLSDLPRDPDSGRYLLDLVLGDEVEQRWAVALPLATELGAWGEDAGGSWQTLRAGLATGAVPGFVLRVRLDP